ncbi:MAG: helix-turn-helix domain-containing protein [Flavipsychrobacter sp.]
MVEKISSLQQNAALRRLLGENIQVAAYNELLLNHNIKAEWLEVAFPENEMPEDQGRLHLFPIDDNKFCLQLVYLQEIANTYTAEVCILNFLPGFFDQYPAEVLMANQPFRFDQTTEQQFEMCAQTRMLLDQLLQSAATPFLQALQQHEAAMQLLRRSLQCITVPFTACQVPACRFLVHDAEREKIMNATRIIESHIDRPMTIRELARKVAMNECYLKKGFKALVGKTIHEYQQSLRITKAKELLQQEGQSVSDVANILGFSSISHFSTAFKKATGMKPCELLH